ncbi:type I-C CRISPR-associated protein Cas8c/Csd1 [Enterocloster lavalensis]|uniref:CRISPR-associated protein Csd1 n=1 Tax=Enterocloster lavalensis TaxID=460384 RepID=A0A1I0HBZ8_9FIRM|nr:type I-C CRISPR-associated protein Cas8c/Csd1 [Enterocloster lavalensis]SET81317.1 CRISPR-associated protein Csd1 [Enterocloster lavalensis]
MNWVNELCDLYDKNQEHAGEMTYFTRETKDGPVEIPLVLLPISHTTVLAQITVTIDHEGNFLRAEPEAGNDRLTIIPVTDKSASRTAGTEPHPLCDNLKYLAGDYMNYYGGKEGKEKDFSQNYEKYIESLRQWCESEFCHEKARAVYQYLRKGCLIRDLAAAGVIKLDENGKMAEKEKIQSIPQTDAFVRFRIERPEALDEQVLADQTGRSFFECWKDKTLQTSFIEYYRSISTERGISYLSGNVEAPSFLQPKKIRNEGDGAKLISSNDEHNFTYRGRFADKSEAFLIGYKDSQKAHNALKWIIRKQGFNWDSFCAVIWESGMNPMPDPRMDTEAIYTEYEGWGEEEAEEVPVYGGTNAAEAMKFSAALRGYGKFLGASSRTVLMAFDSATPGRLSLTEYQQYRSSNYLDNIQYWHESCAWRHEKYKNGRKTAFEGMVGVGDIAEVLYGTEQNGRLTLSGKTKMYGEVFKRLFPCISQRQPVPHDMVRLAVQKASSPVTYKEWYNWERVLAVACSLVKKQRMDHNLKEVWNVALDKNCNDRNYLYGRLLAVADRVEYRTYDKDDRRETNAQRYMAIFAQRPMHTWKVLEEKLQPYWVRLKPGERIVYKKLIEEINDKFTVESYEKDESLNGLYLLGFHSQALDLRQKPESETAQGEKEE